MEIWKFILPITDEIEVDMPDVSIPLNVQLQSTDICLWAMVDPKGPKVKKRFFIVGTGHPFNPADKLYIGTVQKGSFVWHVFELKNY